MKNAKKKQAIEMVKRGATYSQVAEAIGTSTSSVGRWVTAARKAGEAIPEAWTGRPRKVRGSKRPAMPSKASKRSAAAVNDAAELGDGPSVEDRLAEVGALISKASAEGDHQAYIRLIKLEADLKLKQAALRPPPPPDPEADPLYVEARRRLQAQLARVRDVRLRQARVAHSKMCPDCAPLLEGLLGPRLLGVERGSEAEAC